MSTLEITVHGTPAPQGSKRGFVKGGRAVLVDDNKGPLRDWRHDVTAAAVAARGEGWEPISGPVGLEVYFTFRRPRGHFGTGRNAGKIRLSAPPRPAVAPDLSKLIRAVEDALTDAGVWRDDALVVAISAGKFYDGHGFTGARIMITEYRGRLA